MTTHVLMCTLKGIKYLFGCLFLCLFQGWCAKKSSVHQVPSRSIEAFYFRHWKACFPATKLSVDRQKTILEGLCTFSVMPKILTAVVHIYCCVLIYTKLTSAAAAVPKSQKI
jgi:hypothetical protein